MLWAWTPLWADITYLSRSQPPTQPLTVLFVEISVAWQHNWERLGRRLQAWHEYTSHFSQQTCCKSLICAFCWALFSFPLSISDLSLLIVSKRVSCFSVIICLLCEDKNVIQKAAPTTPRQWELKLSVISSIVSLRNRTSERLTVKKVTELLPACFVGNSLNINVFCSSTKRSVWRNEKFGEEEKRRFCLNHAKPLKSLHLSLWTSQSCFLSSNWFFEWEHPFIDKPMVKNWARYTKKTAIRLGWQGGLIAGLHVMSRRPCWWSRTKTFLSSGN